MICFDMDGVLVKYEREAYVGDKPKYLEPGYFATLEADDTMVSLIKYCLRMVPLDTFITTSVHPDYRNQMIMDKLRWIDKHIPEFDIGTRFVANSSMDKSALFEHIRKSSITNRDILIDDYNPRLFNWEMRGGTAIKYLNGINSKESWHGPVIRYDNHTYCNSELFMIMMEASACR